MSMKSVQVRFPEEELERIDGLVARGEYPSRAEYIRDAVRKVEMLHAIRELRDRLQEQDIDLDDLLEGSVDVRKQLYDEWFGRA